jgi:hypothetical protein
MERAVLAREALANNSGVFVDQDRHGCPKLENKIVGVLLAHHSALANRGRVLMSGGRPH